jgi:HD superfamily phosphohydrolase
MTKSLRDPIYGSVVLSDAELAVIDTPAFQRLRHVNQLGLSNFVYHGAEHSRFGHSIGVLHTVSRAFDSIATDDADKLGWTTEERNRNRALLRLAGLLHDVGHAPFSHAAEDAIEGGLSHEAMGRRLLVDSELGDIVDGEYRSAGISRSDVVDLWTGALPSESQFLTELVTSDLDCDRMDYLLRDSHYAGVAYGRFDQERLLTSLSVVEDEDGQWSLAVREGGLYALESLILARYFMFLQVYFHKVRRVLDLLLGRYVATRGGYRADLTEYLALDDPAMWVEMRASGEDSAQRLVGRKPFKEVFHSNPMATDTERAVYQIVRPELEEAFGPQVLFDDASTSTHKFELPYGEQSSSTNPLTIVTDDGPRPFHEMSRVVANLERKVHWLRIFAAPEVYSEVKARWQEAWSRVS